MVEEAGLGEKQGEPDHLCWPVSGTLKPTFNPMVGQVMLTMMDESGNQPSQLEPRQILKQIVEKIQQRNQFPVVALELEFYLLDKQRNSNGEIQSPINPAGNYREVNCDVYNLDNLDDYADFLTDLSSAAEQQGLNTSGALAESAPGQFEINFYHQKDVLAACDQVIQAKRLIRQVAHKYDFDVTFMAKPFAEEAGNGMHIHMSLLNGQEENLFSNKQGDPSDLFHQTIGAMLAMMPESMALLCPSVNSYRRFVEGMFTPLFADWGVNHRGVALRIPMSDNKNRRIEHRIAGADVNPYILCSVLLASVLAADSLMPKHCPNPLSDKALPLPRIISDALRMLEKGDSFSDYLGEDFVSLYHTCKQSELAEFEQHITPLEVEWMLYSA